jgi:N-acetylglutamate synthase-like GNAT family acetyltransferase
MTITIRQAVATDRRAVVALVDREVRAGTVLPRPFIPEHFVVAESGRRIMGTLATTRWADGVVELGTVISAERGHGVGARLVRAGLERARDAGGRWAVVLTGVPDFFSRQGFTVSSDTPWARARGPVLALDEHDVAVAIGAKAESSCRSCPYLATCQQVMMVRRLDAAAPAWRACA